MIDEMGIQKGVQYCNGKLRGYSDIGAENIVFENVPLAKKR